MLGTQMNLGITCENLNLCTSCLQLLQVWFTDWEPTAKNILSRLNINKEAETSMEKARLKRDSLWVWRERKTHIDGRTAEGVE